MGRNPVSIQGMASVAGVKIIDVRDSLDTLSDDLPERALT